MSEIQLSFFPDYADAIDKVSNTVKENDDFEGRKTLISERITDEFAVYQIPFLGCNFDVIYPKIADILPTEAISFRQFGLEASIACELICAAICHQMNWDFLREAVFKKTKCNIEWLSYNYLCSISETDISEMLKGYNKTERIRAGERAALLRDVGKMISRIGGCRQIFFDEQMNLLSCEEVRAHLLSCPTFSQDPNEKKLQLLLQKLSNIEGLEGLGAYYQPAIDYHLIRCYLRRGLIYPKTQYAENFIKDSSVQRRESTVGAMRQLCSELMKEICWYTSLDISTVNLVEWHIGRSVCVQENPDCFLNLKEALWLRPVFDRCPFYENCAACQYKRDYLNIQEPSYNGRSY